MIHLLLVCSAFCQGDVVNTPLFQKIVSDPENCFGTSEKSEMRMPQDIEANLSKTREIQHNPAITLTHHLATHDLYLLRKTFDSKLPLSSFLRN